MSTKSLSSRQRRRLLNQPADDQLERLRNLGPRSAAWLQAVGINSISGLREMGAVPAFLKVEAAGLAPSLNLLWALEGALRDCHWTQLDPGLRAALLLSIDAARDQKYINNQCETVETSS